MKKLLISVGVALLSVSAQAADLAVKAPANPFYSSTPCVAGSCSGWYAGFGLVGEGTNADIIGSGLNNSVFAAGGAIKVQAGYQLWSGQFLAGIEGSVGYSFITPANQVLVAPTPVTAPTLVGLHSGSKFIGMEIVKLGYNFFPSAASAPTSPSQSPVSLIVPANFLAASTPYLAFGGLQRNGKNMWVSGVGVDTVIAAGWTSTAKYLYAPAVNGLPATNLVMLELNKHF
jgi:hypothetical protein